MIAKVKQSDGDTLGGCIVDYSLVEGEGVFMGKVIDGPEEHIGYEFDDWDNYNFIPLSALELLAMEAE